MSQERESATRRRLTREERELWRSTMADVHPLRRKRRRDAEAADVPVPEVELTASAPKAKPCPVTAARPTPPPPRPRPQPAAPPPDLAPGDNAGVDRRTATRLRRGKLDVEARLDLHGHGRESAHRALNAFIQFSTDAGRRCVLVVTGKGSRDGGIGVIRAAVPQWLNLAPLREHILSYNAARPQDGGEGAIYILLRRKREKKA